jgi:hypothetical protein
MSNRAAAEIESEIAVLSERREAQLAVNPPLKIIRLILKVTGQGAKSHPRGRVAQ